MKNRKLDQVQKPEFFKNLPTEVTMGILSRLPVKSAVRCKSVCKTWLSLLTTEAFVESHLSKALPGLAVNDPDSCMIYDFNEVDDAAPAPALHYAPLLNFHFINHTVVQGSSNGVLLTCYQSLDPTDRDLIYALNPVTFEYIQLIGCDDFVFKEDRVVTYGFGESRGSRQLKAVRVSHDCVRHEETEELLCIYKLECRVYTLGTGEWRSVRTGAFVEYDPASIGAVLYGNMHWLVFDIYGRPMISCFDLEREVFSFLPPPPLLYGGGGGSGSGGVGGSLLLDLHAMEDRLCVSDNGSNNVFVVWTMKEYQVKRTWTRDLVIRKLQIPYFVRTNSLISRAVKMFRDGDVLVMKRGGSFFHYSTKNGTAHGLEDVFDKTTSTDAILHTSSFFSLRKFVNEDVCSFRPYH